MRDEKSFDCQNSKLDSLMETMAFWKFAMAYGEQFAATDSILMMPMCFAKCLDSSKICNPHLTSCWYASLNKDWRILLWELWIRTSLAIIFSMHWEWIFDWRMQPQWLGIWFVQSLCRCVPSMFKKWIELQFLNLLPFYYCNNFRLFRGLFSWMCTKWQLPTKFSPLRWNSRLWRWFWWAELW
jgi:hypothetical protein